MPFLAVAPDALPMQHPVAVFHAFWRDAAGGKAIAPWARFDPTDHPKILPWVLLLKREACPAPADGFQLRYAVCGTGCTEMFGFSYEGKLFGDDLPPDAVARRQAEFDRVMAGSGPLFTQTEIPVPEREFVRVFRGVFPFAAEGQAADHLMVIIAEVARRI